MWIVTVLALVAVALSVAAPAAALEGSSAAGPIGGTDIRSAQLPPPGLYAGNVTLFSKGDRFYDRHGDSVHALGALDLMRTRLGPFLLYVPDVELFGGSIGIAGVFPVGTECGHLFATTPTRCIAGVGDTYVEIGWSRYFGTRRPSQYPGAYPVAEGLTLALGFGTVIPIGRYNAFDATLQGLTIGNNLWVFAPTAAATYVTKPIIADGTEFSARFYWNNYLVNPDTQYLTGTLLNLDFAVTEKIGRFQAGLAGFYSSQVEDDKRFGVPVPPDGRRAAILMLGAVAAYDIPEYGAFLKVKPLISVFSQNTVKSYGIAFTFAKKL